MSVFLKKIYYHLKDKVIFGRPYRKTKDTFFLIYTMTKVGTLTTFSTFRKTFPYMKLVNVHFMTEAGEKQCPKGFEQGGIAARNAVIRFREQHPDMPLKVISLVRDPVARLISEIFEKIDVLFPGREYDNIGIDELLEEFYSRDVNYPYKWFKEDFNTYLSMDVFASPFDKKQGYSIYHVNEKTSVLLIKLEKISSVFAKATHEFLGVSLTEIVRDNSAKDKGYYTLYKQFINTLKPISKETLDAFYDTPFMKTFYTDEEISSFYAKWNNL